jgi:uncharacterized membrane protein YfcA
MLPIETLALVAGVFVLAGWVKGVVGMGMPTVVMGALGLVMAPVQAAALLVMPALITNIWQFAAGPAAGAVVRRLGVLLVLMCIGTAIGAQLLTSGGSRLPTIALGTVLAAYAALGLVMPRLTVPAGAERHLAPVVGGLTGLLSGATGVSVVPLVPYLGALGLGREELIQALGLSFAVASVALGVALGATGSYPQASLLTSIAAVVPAGLGMLLGQAVRGRIDQAAFRRWFFVAMLAIGVITAGKGLLAG